MKKILQLTIYMLWTFTFVHAQKYNADNSLSRVALVYYYEDENGFYQKKENVNLQEVFAIVSSYGYNKKTHELYLITNRANCVITLTDNFANFMKKEKRVPFLKGKELEDAISQHSNELSERFNRLNTLRKKHIEDSIAKAKADSIEKARADSLKQVENKKKQDIYRKEHSWHWLPIERNRLYCILCDDVMTGKDSVFINGIVNDTIYYMELKEGVLDQNFLRSHVIPVPNNLKKSEKYLFHIETYRDSIMYKSYLTPEFMEYFNAEGYIKYIEEVKKEAPYGFVESWGWDDKYSQVTMYLKYTNTNKKTIKYIDVYFRITNDVGDVRKTGVFKGTGPIGELESGSWDWDSSRYYVAGDASNMLITQIVLTYMDGTKKTLSKGQIKYN